MNVSLRYASKHTVEDDLRWMKSLLRIPPLRGLSIRQTDKSIGIEIDQVSSLPATFFHLFEEDL